MRREFRAQGVAEHLVWIRGRTWSRLRGSGPVSVGTVDDRCDLDDRVCVIQQVENPIGAASRGPRWCQWRVEWFANPMRIVQQWTGDERVSGNSYFFRQNFSQGFSCWTSNA